MWTRRLPLLIVAALGVPSSSESAPAANAVELSEAFGGDSPRWLSADEGADDDGQESASICDVGGRGIILPLLPDENSWNKPARALLYFCGLAWCFIGVSIVADVFMGAIEAITGKRKTVKLSNGRKIVVRVWNDTVANLTLMALGSSAPEILLSCIEIVGAGFYSGDLGPSTIVGSAAFNLLVILAVCMYVIPNGQARTIKRPAVFMITAIGATFAYLWLVVIIGISSPDMIEPWEGVATFVFFPVLVVLAFLADKGKLGWCQKSAAAEELSKHDALAELKPHEVKLLEGNVDRGKSRAQMRKGVGKIEVEKEPPPTDLSVGFLAPIFSFPKSASELVLELEKTGKRADRFDVAVEWRTSTGDEGSTVILKHETRGKIVIRPGQQPDQALTVELTRARATCSDANRLDRNRGSGDQPLRVQFGSLLEKSKTCHITREHRSAKVQLCSSWEGAPGQLRLTKDKIEHFPSTEKSTTCQIKVERINGASGRIECRLVTVADSARPAYPTDSRSGDYVHVETIVVFEPGVTENVVDIIIQRRSRTEAKDKFFVELKGAEGIVVEGAAASCAVIIREADETTDVAVRMARWLDAAVNLDQLHEGNSDYLGQFRDAIWPIAEGEDEVSAQDWCLHFVALPWKLLFALIPPVAYAGGWLCFVVALLFIGGVTAFIGDLASLMGCCLGLPDAVTAITIVALGTSLPDTFASKVAAVEDDSADNAIGNVTGSNAVNVFLGLGLPWMMASFYWAGGSPPEKWQLRYPEQFKIYPDGGFIVLAGDLVFSVLVFMMCSVCALAVIYYRRKAYSAELGGPAGIKLNSAILFVLLWVMYVGCASWKVFAGDVSVARMVLAVMVGVAALILAMIVIVSLAHMYEGWHKREKERKSVEKQVIAEAVVEAFHHPSFQATSNSPWASARRSVWDGSLGRHVYMDSLLCANNLEQPGPVVAGNRTPSAIKKLQQHLQDMTDICEELAQLHANIMPQTKLEDSDIEGAMEEGQVSSQKRKKKKKDRSTKNLTGGITIGLPSRCSLATNGTE